MIAGFVIWSICTVLFAGIGIYCRMTKDAVGFFTFAEAQKVNDVKGYNNTVARVCGNMGADRYSVTERQTKLAHIYFYSFGGFCLGHRNDSYIH